MQLVMKMSLLDKVDSNKIVSAFKQP